MFDFFTNWGCFDYVGKKQFKPDRLILEPKLFEIEIVFRFVIPIYQRAYSWTEKECRQRWDDILRIGATEEISAHL